MHDNKPMTQPPIRYMNRNLKVSQSSVQPDPAEGSSTPPEDDILAWTLRNTSRTREQIKTADSYSRFVEFMRIALPVGAAVLVISVVLYSNFWGSRDGISFFLPSETDMGQELHMTNPRFVSRDSANRPIEMTAELAVQDVDNPDLVHLQTIHGKVQVKAPEMTVPGELSEITLAARTGVFNTKNEHVVLNGDVRLRSNTDYMFATEEVEVDLQHNEVLGSKPVHGEGALGIIDADTFRIWGNGNHILFSGNVKTQFFPEQLDDQDGSGTKLP